jgi:hypothetical protein
MKGRIVIPLSSLALFFLISFDTIFSEELSDTKTLSFTKNLVVQKYKKGKVQAEPYTVKAKDNIWKILVSKYGIQDRQFYFFCRIAKSLNPTLKNAHEIVPNQVLLIPFKYIPHFNIKEEELKAIFHKILSSHYSQIPTEEYTFSKGEHVAQVLRDMYSIPDEVIFNRYLNLLKQLNPDVKDINLVIPNQKIMLPSFTSFQLPSEEDELKKFAVEEPSVKKAQREEILNTEEVTVEKELEQIDIDSRSKKIAKQVPGSKALSLHDMSAIADVLGGSLTRTGEFIIPLMREGQIKINTSSFPILQLTDNKKILLNYDDKLPSGLIELVKLERNDFEVIDIKKYESMKSVLDKIITTAGYYSVDKSKNPLVIGDQIQFEILGDWIIYEDEFLKDITVVNLTEKEISFIDTELKEYLYTYGVNLVDLYFMDEGGQEKEIFPPKADEQEYHPEGVSEIDASDCMVLVDSVLTLLGQNFKRDFTLKLFQETSEGFNVEVVADRYFEREGKGHVISFHEIPEKLTEVIVRQGNRFLNLYLPLDDPLMVIKSVCDLLRINHDAPRPSFSYTSNGEKKIKLIIPGILIAKDKETHILFTSLELDEEVYQWLAAKKVKVVHLEIPPTIGD